MNLPSKATLLFSYSVILLTPKVNANYLSLLFQLMMVLFTQYMFIRAIIKENASFTSFSMLEPCSMISTISTQNKICMRKATKMQGNILSARNRRNSKKIATFYPQQYLTVLIEKEFTFPNLKPNLSSILSFVKSCLEQGHQYWRYRSSNI